MNKKFSLGRSSQKNLVLFVILMLICAFFTIQNNRFLGMYNLMSMVRQSLPNVIIGCAMTFVIASGGIDLSVGGVMALAAIVFGHLCVWGVNPWLAALLIVVLGIIMGVINTMIMEKLQIPGIMATLATWIATSGLALTLCRAIPISDPEVKAVTVLNSMKFLDNKIPLALILVIITVAVFIFLEKKTIIGKYAIAIGGNDAAALFSGINVLKMRTIFFVFSGVMAALSGIWQVGRLGSADPTIGTGMEFNVIAACILGGVNIKGGEGTIVGVVIGTTILTVLTNGMQMMNIDSFYQQVTTGIVLLGAILINGLSGKVKIRKATVAVQ